MYQEDLKDVVKSDCIMTEIFTHLYNSADVKSDYEALTVLLHFFMLENGFKPKNCSNEEKHISVPENWKTNNGVFRISYLHNCCLSPICTMTCVPLYNTLAINGVICDINCSDSINLNVKIDTYLKSRRDFSCPFKVFHKCSELSRDFKDNFCLPLLNLLHESSGTLPLYGLYGLLDEIKAYLLEFLPVESVVAMSAVNKNFNQLSNSPYLWKHLYLRDFSKDSIPDVASDSETNWKELYQNEYLKKKRKKLQTRPLMYHPYRLPSQLFPDYDFDIGIGFNPPPPHFFPPFQDPYLFPPGHPFHFRRL